MGLGDDIKHTAEDLAGKAKEAIGKATDNDKLVAEGKAEFVADTAKKSVVKPKVEKKAEEPVAETADEAPAADEAEADASTTED